MSRPVVELDGVWKRFRRGARHDSLRDLLPVLGGRLFRRGRAARERAEFWALEDVSFTVHAGEAVGVIGPNGAGKSTLLKLLYRILRPTRGRIQTVGRVGGLIEVAAGFHPDLTGRENIYLQGAIYGLHTREVAARFDSIVDFAGVPEFVDTPVKRYSSGMQARLGFAVAAHLDPDLLLIDEVLAVGDAVFQTKCFDRMKAFKREGAAIVFVSHNMQAVSELCDRVIFLRNSVRQIGAPSETIGSYLAWARGNGQKSTGSRVTIGPTRLLDMDGKLVDVVRAGEGVKLEAQYEVRDTTRQIAFGLAAYRSTDGLLVYAEDFTCEQLGLTALPHTGRFSLDFGLTPNLVAGQYHLELYVFDPRTTHYLAQLAPAALLRVQETRPMTGVADLRVSARSCTNGVH
jgi:homopolymeric O-antigen transport system ATP-binding protein